jgi:hypothetical protein
MTGDDSIRVAFSSGQQSYTDGQKIVVISASNDPEKFDSMVGLALHEASHVLYTQPLFDMMVEMKNVPEAFMTPKIIEGMEKHNLSTRQFQSHFHLMLNFLEDRKIDVLSYQKLGGYRPYYEANYEELFYSDFINKALAHPMFRQPFFKCYEMHILNMFSDKADPDALPGLRKIWDIVDLPNILRYHNDPKWNSWRNAMNPHKFGQYYSSLPKIVSDAQRMLEVIYEHADMSGNPNMDEMGEGFKDPYKTDVDERADLPNYDMPDGDDEDGEGQEMEELSPEEVKEILDKIRDQVKFTNGDTNKETIDENQENTMEDLEAADAELREAGQSINGSTKAKSIVYKKLDEQVLHSPGYPFRHDAYGMFGGKKSESSLQPNRISQRAVEDGIKMGQQLAHRIRFMNDETSMKFSRQNHGRLDKRLIHQLGYADTNVFAVEHLIQAKPVLVDISIDSSGSMMGTKWERALTFAVAMAYVAEKTRKVNVRISLRTGWHDVQVGIMYDSRTDKFQKVKKLFPFLGPTGGTPEGLAFESIMKELLDEVKSVRRYFVNLSDGMPQFSFSDQKGNHVSYHGNEAAEHTALQVKELRSRGVKILSYYITDYEEEARRMNKNKNSMFHTMYGSDAAFINVESVVEIANTLNKFFMEE